MPPSLEEPHLKTGPLEDGVGTQPRPSGSHLSVCPSACGDVTPLSCIISEHRNNHRAEEASGMGLEGPVMVSSSSMTDEPICLLLQFLFNYSGAKQ